MLSINFFVIFNDLWNRVVLPFVREGTQLLGRHTHAVHTPYGALTEAPGHTAQIRGCFGCPGARGAHGQVGLVLGEYSASSSVGCVHHAAGRLQGD